jgi:Holliday junction resolvase RusA-like endonuclease
MPKLDIFVPVVPVAQKRARSCAVKTAAGGHVARTYKHSKQRKAEDNLREMIYQKLPEGWSPLSHPLELEVDIALPIPKSTAKKLRELMLERKHYHTKKPDLDNLVKHIKDVCKGVVWLDDKQIWYLQAIKYYSPDPGWHVRIWWAED